MLRKILLAIIAIIFVCSTGWAEVPAEETKLVITTVVGEGAYYPVSVAISTLLSNRLAKKNISAKAVGSSGHLDNIRLLETQKADLTILRGLEGAMAYKRAGAYQGKEFRNFRSITMLWENVEHFICDARQAASGNIADLSRLNREYSFGPKGGLNEISGQVIFKALNLNQQNDPALVFMDDDPAYRALLAGRIAGAYFSDTPPVRIIDRLYREKGERKIALLEFSDEQVQRLRYAYPVWSGYIIKAGTYAGQQKDINTCSQPSFLACRTDLPDETVYLITKTIYDNLQFMHNIHPATRAIKIERALNGLPAPLHPGAARYFTEKGIKIPPELVN